MRNVFDSAPPPAATSSRRPGSGCSLNHPLTPSQNIQERKMIFVILGVFLRTITYNSLPMVEKTPAMHSSVSDGFPELEPGRRPADRRSGGILAGLRFGQGVAYYARMLGIGRGRALIGRNYRMELEEALLLLFRGLRLEGRPIKEARSTSARSRRLR
jgi:hypothetical protein